MKQILAFSIFFFVFSFSHAKKKYDTIYVDSSEVIRKTKDFKYYRLITKIEKNNYKIQDFYRDGSLKSVGYSESDSKPQWLYSYEKHGIYESYFKGENKLKSKEIFNKGLPKKVSLRQFYFPNGNLYLVDSIGENKNYILEIYENNGNPLVKNGNGFATIYENDIEDYEYISKGKVVGGLKDSLWSSRRIKSSDLYYNEKYNLGNFIGGVSYDSDGKMYKYKEIYVLPKFEDEENISKLFEYIGDEIKYPPECMNKNIQGTIYVKFTIGPDGRISNYYNLNQKHHMLEEEAIRVVKSLNGKLSPKLVRGQYATYSLTIPIGFKISSSKYHVR